MKTGRMQALKIAAVYAGSVLGAGFASGQELMLFFVRYGVRGLWGSVLAGLMFAILGAMLLSRAKTLKEAGFRNYLISVFGEKAAAALYWIVEGFLAVSFCIMLSGSGALFWEQLGLPRIFGILLTALICFLVLQGDLKALTALNVLLAPLMTLGIAATSAGYLAAQHREIWLSFAIGDNRFLVSVFLYVSFNMLSATAVLVPLSKLASERRTAAAGGFAGGLFLLLAAVLACAALYAAYAELDGAQLPLLSLSRSLHTAFAWIYALVLYMAMLTTAAANGFAVVEHFVARGASRRTASLLLCLVAVPASLFPFSGLVECCYTFFGILGLLLLCGIVYDWFRRR